MYRWVVFHPLYIQQLISCRAEATAQISMCYLRIDSARADRLCLRSLGEIGGNYQIPKNSVLGRDMNDKSYCDKDGIGTRNARPCFGSVGVYQIWKMQTADSFNSFYTPKRFTSLTVRPLKNSSWKSGFPFLGPKFTFVIGRTVFNISDKYCSEDSECRSGNSDVSKISFPHLH